MRIINRIKAPLVILVGALFVWSCSSAKKTEIDRTLTVKIDSVRHYTNQLSVSYPGKVKASSDVDLAFRVSGTLLRVNVDVGSVVRKGEVLAEIDPRDYKTQVAATEAEYNRIKGEAERIMTLYERRSVSKNDYEKAKYGLQQITSKLEAHRNALIDTKLRAPYDGFVQKKLFDSNETVSAGIPVISMINKGMPEVEINIPGTDYFDKESFDSFICTIDLFPGEVYPLTLSGISHKANLNQLYTMRFTFQKGTQKRLPTPGMTATVKINKKTDDTSLTSIPISAVFNNEEGESSVWVYNPTTHQVQSRIIRLVGLQRDGLTIVSHGLEAGEQVVIAGVHSLEENCKVVPLPPNSKTNIGGLL